MMSLRKKINGVLSDSPKIAMIAALIGSSLIALSPLFVRFSEVGSTATAFYRFFFALPILWTWMIFDNIKPEKHRTPRTIREYFLLMIAGVVLSMDISFWHLAMINTSVVNAILLNSMTPVFVALASWIILKEKITAPLGLGILLAIIGSVILVGSGAGNQASNITGDIYGIISAVFYAAYMLCLKELRKSFSAPTIMFWMALSGMYVLGVNSHIMNEVVVPQTLGGWGVVFSLTLVVHILGGALMSYSIAHLTATFSSLTILVGPFVAAILGWFVFGESLSIMQTAGGLVVILGIVLAKQKKLTFSRRKT